jgi:hypothetical protein
MLGGISQGCPGRSGANRSLYRVLGAWLGEPQLAGRKIFHKLCFESKALLPRESVTFSVTGTESFA